MILVAGATGALGGRVVEHLLQRSKKVRALVREGSDASKLQARGVEIARGDLLDRASLERALDGATALVTTAAGYMRRRKGDSLEKVDDLGNRNLIDAARAKKVGRFVFTSVLTCDRAPSVPHFWQKKLTEDYLEASGVPFVSLRPGAFIAAEIWAPDLKKGRLTSIGRADVRWSWIGIDDVARALATAVEEPRVLGRRIDLGMDRALSIEEAAAAFSTVMGRKIRVRKIPWLPVSLIMRAAGLFNPTLHDFRLMFEYFLSGAYVADTTQQRELLGGVPTVEKTFHRFVHENGIAPL